ncbi:MAG: hypothetical protein QM679_01340 [Patulibacter sp.]
MRLLPAPAPCSPRRRRSLAVTSAVAVLAAAAVPGGAAAATTLSAAWTAPLTLGPAPSDAQQGLVPRLALTSTGRGTVAWNVAGDGTVVSRDFTVGGTLGTTTTVTRGSLTGSVARDQAGNVAVTGQTAGSPAISWVATRPKAGTTWTFRTVASGTYVNAPASFGLASGFLVASTSSFVPTTADAGLPTAALLGFTTAPGDPVALGKALEGVETGDFAHGADGSNWALSSDGHALTTGRRETTKAKDGTAAESVAALVRTGKSPTRYSILGADAFGGGAVATVGDRIAVAGLEVQQSSAIAQRGIPVVALGSGGTIGKTTEIGGVPDRRALEVDVAGRVGGGAVVTWLQQSTSTIESLAGQPKWAVVDDAGEVEARGTFTSAKDARDLRIVRVGSVAVAVWIRGTGSSARWQAAKVTGDDVQLIKAPTGTPVGHVEGGLNTSQLTANGSVVALSFVDAASGAVRVAATRVR